MGISHGESSRRPTRSANHGRPGQYGESCPGELSPELPGAEKSGERRTDEASATPLPWHPAPGELDQSEGTRGDIVRSLKMQTSPPGLDRTSSKYAPSPRCGSSSPRVSAPVWTRCLFLN